MTRDVAKHEQITAEQVQAAAQHRAVMGDELTASSVRDIGGQIAVLPAGNEGFEEVVRRAGGTVTDLNRDTRGLVWMSNTQIEDITRILRENPQLTWVQLPWAGVDAFSDVIAENARDTLTFTSAKGAYAQPVAEHALGLIIAAQRLLAERARAKQWDSTPKGQSLYGKNVTILGAGGIGRELIRLLAPFETRITVVRRRNLPVKGAERVVTLDQLDEALNDADVVVLALSLTEQTRELFGAREFALLKPSTVLVNVARGDLVNQEALVAALTNESFLGYATDVTTPEPLPEGHAMWSTPHLLITPHMADTPDMVGPLIAERIRVNVDAFVTGKPFVGVVDPAAGY